MNNFSQRLRELRAEYGLSQPAFARFLGLKPTSYPNYEKYDTYPCIDDLKKMASGLDVSLDYLCGRTDEMKKLSDDFLLEKSIPFSKRVKELRQKTGMTQLQVTEALGLLALSDYFGYESGLRRPKFSRLIALADLFGVTLDELVGFNKK